MTIMTIRIPDDVKEAFDKAFEGQDKDAIIAQFIRDGLAARGVPEMADALDRDLAESRGKDLGTTKQNAGSFECGHPQGARRRPPVKLVVDASVAVKWFFHNKAGEQEVAQALNILDALQAGGAAYRLGASLSRQLKHHFFDTLYHAIAIEQGAMLITADNSYFAKAFRLGNIKLLTSFTAS